MGRGAESGGQLAPRGTTAGCRGGPLGRRWHDNNPGTTSVALRPTFAPPRQARRQQVLHAVRRPLLGHGRQVGRRPLERRRNLDLRRAGATPVSGRCWAWWLQGGGSSRRGRTRSLRLNARLWQPKAGYLADHPCSATKLQCGPCEPAHEMGALAPTPHAAGRAHLGDVAGHLLDVLLLLCEHRSLTYDKVDQASSNLAVAA